MCGRYKDIASAPRTLASTVVAAAFESVSLYKSVSLYEPEWA
jgi:hypothetical protein